jgi:hypothetical protein
MTIYQSEINPKKPNDKHKNRLNRSRQNLKRNKWLKNTLMSIYT